MRRLLLFSCFTTLLLTACSAPKKTYSGSKSKPGSSQRQPDRTGTSEQNEVYTPRNTDGYLQADGLTTNKKLSKVVNEWLGVPHRIGGKDKSGIDCSGFTSVVLRQVYQKELVGPSATMATKCQEIKKNELKEGDLVFFKINGVKVSHVGVYLSKGYFAHATVKKGVLISSLAEPYYEKYYSGSGRVL